MTNPRINKKNTTLKTNYRVLSGLLLRLGIVCVVSVVPVSLVLAQDAVLEEVIVTAQKREQNLMDVPISVSVTSGETIQNQNFRTLVDFSERTPSFQVREGGPIDFLIVRGVGSGNNGSFEQAVGTFVDGVYRGRARQSRGAFLDLERIELLKGPQGTFFGNNAVAGALNITTRKPGNTFEGYAIALYEPTDGEYNLEAAAGGPLTDTLSARIAGKKYGMDGYIKDLTIDDDVPRVDDVAGRITLAWTPNDYLDATFKVDVGRTDAMGASQNQAVNCPPLAPFPGPAGFCSVNLALGVESNLDDKRSLSSGQNVATRNHEYVFTLNYENWGHRFTSLTALLNFNYSLQLDIDLTPLQLFNVDSTEDLEQFSQEFRIASSPGGRFDYMAGFYYQEVDLRYQNNFAFNFLSPIIAGIPPFAPLVPLLPLGQSVSFNQDEKSVALFGSFTWNITDRVSTTLGMRWTQVDKDFTQNIFYGTPNDPYARSLSTWPSALQPLASFLGLGTAGTIALSRQDEDVTPSLNVKFDVTDDLMAYASYARGFKAGGFDGTSKTGDETELPFDPESVDAYEVGLKGRFLDGRMRFTLAAFRSEYTNLQLAITQLQGAAIINTVESVGASTSQGVEIGLTWAASDRLRIGLEFAPLDSFFVDYKNAGPTALQVLEGLTSQDLSGRRNAPKYTGNFNAQYTHPLPNDLGLITELNVYFNGNQDMGSDLDPALVQDAYAKVDLRVSFGPADRRWSFSAIGKNLTNETILNFATDMPASPGSYVMNTERGRSIALQARYSW